MIDDITFYGEESQLRCAAIDDTGKLMVWCLEEKFKIITNKPDCKIPYDQSKVIYNKKHSLFFISNPEQPLAEVICLRTDK